MVKWSDTWFDKLDANGIKFGKWVERKSSTHALCRLCNRELKFDQQGLQALKQHSGKPKHVEVSRLAFSDAVRRFETTTPPSSSTSTSCPPKKVFLGISLQEKVTAAEAMWLFKIAEEDMTLRDCDNVPALFQRMFSDSEIAKAFTMGRSKASYVLQDGLGPLLAKWLCENVSESEGTFSLIFDETTTNQRQKQMDLLLRYWDEKINLVVTKYLRSLNFCRAGATDLASMMLDVIDGDEHDIDWRKLFFLSSDGPNINKAVYRNLNENLKKNAERLKKEEEERKRLERLTKEQEQQKKMALELEKAEKRKEMLDKKESELQTDEAKLEKRIQCNNEDAAECTRTNG